MQSQREYQDAVFQVASNFSALEPTSQTYFPEYGISNYVFDKTQGPFAAISATPGLIQRMYYAFYAPYTEPSMWRQTGDHQIELLGDTDIPVKNGYIVIDDAYIKKLSQEVDINAYFESQLEHIKIGFQGGTQVTFGFCGR